MPKNKLRTVLLVAGATALVAPAASAYPGTNGALAFTSTENGARHIFVTTAGGITDLTGTSSSATETQPKFSPDGREIVFTRSAPGLPNSEIFVMGAGGGQRTRLTDTSAGNSDPTWSPNGTQIAFVSLRSGGVPQIFIMRSDGTDIRQITHDRAGKAQLAWSPTGNRIAFVRAPVSGGDREIYSINTNGSGMVDLTNDRSSFDVEPAWSPDGTQIVYSGPFQPGNSVGQDLWIMNANGTNKHALTHEDNGYSDGAYPAWSPDGTMIAFVANNGTGYYHVWEVSANGGQNVEVVKNNGAGNPVDEEVDWRALPTGAIPGTRISAASVRGATASFSFAATGPATGFRCELRLAGHQASFTACRSPRVYRGLKPGTYTFSVIAHGPNEPYRTPAQRTFKIGS